MKKWLVDGAGSILAAPLSKLLPAAGWKGQRQATAAGSGREPTAAGLVGQPIEQAKATGRGGGRESFQHLVLDRSAP